MGTAVLLHYILGKLTFSLNIEYQHNTQATLIAVQNTAMAYTILPTKTNHLM